MSQKIYFTSLLRIKKFIKFRHLNLQVKDSFGTKFSFYNDFTGTNTSGQEMYNENSS